MRENAPGHRHGRAGGEHPHGKMGDQEIKAGLWHLGTGV